MDINGTSGPDTLNGTSGNDVIRGLEGNDRIDGGGGQDLIYGGGGDDEIGDPAGGGDSLYGEAGNDTLTVNFAALLADGGEGNDVITLNAGASAGSALGGEGDDRFNVHSQFSQRLTGGPGQDYFWFKKGIGSTITDFETGAGGDRLDIATFFADPQFTDWDGVGDLFELGYAALTDSDAGTILWFDRDGGADSLVPYLYLPGADPTEFTSDNFVGMSPTVVVTGPPVGGVLQGSIRNDLFAGGAGAHVEAGPGEDRIDYQGDIAGHEIAYGNGSWYVLTRHPGGGAATVDRLDEVERARFGDGDLQMRSMAIETRFGTSDFSQAGTVLAVPGGGFVLIWSGEGSAGPGSSSVYFQFHNSAGVPVGDVRTAFDSFSWSYGSDAAYLPDGGFVIVAARLDGGGDGLIGRVFNADGTPRSPEFTVNTTILGNERRADIAVLASGGFAVAWSSDSAVASGQLFDAEGDKLGSEFAIGGPSDPVNGDVALAPLADGGFAAFWVNGPDAYVRRFGADGQPSGDSVQVSETELPGFAGVESAVLPDGRVMLVWEDGYAVWARAFDPDTDSLGDVIKVNRTSSATVPSIAVFADGSFVIAWEQSLATRKTLAQRFDSEGGRVGGEFTVSEGEMQPAPKIAALDGGRFVATYQDGTFSPLFTSGIGVAVMTGPGLAQGGVAVAAPGALSARAGTGAADVLAGTAGDDVIDGRGGDDRLTAGQGGRDVVLGGGGVDRLEIDWSSAASPVALAGGLAASAGGGHDGILVTAGARVEFRGIESFDLRGGAAGDTLAGGAGDDLLSGGGGNDTLLAGAGTDALIGGDGNDVLYFGAGLGAGDAADGGAGRDALVIQGNVTATLSETNFYDIESISLQSGSRTTWGDTANNFYDYDITMDDGNVPAGVQLIVNGQSLRLGEDFTFDGSAETDGSFLVYAGHGTDILKGGTGNDVFFFEGQRWGAADRVDGGAGRDAVVISAGSGLNRFEFGPDSFANIESISVSARYATDPTQKPSYELVLHNGNVTPGGSLIVNGSSLGADQTIGIDGSAVTGGSLTLFGSAGSDTLKGGAGNDLLYAGGARDILHGGGGSDIFQYRATSDSTMDASDSIGDFQGGLDKIDLHFIDADVGTPGDQSFTFIGSASFSGQAGQLRIVDMGNNMWVAMADTDGNSWPDFFVGITRTDSSPMTAPDFIL